MKNVFLKENTIENDIEYKNIRQLHLVMMLNQKL